MKAGKYSIKELFNNRTLEQIIIPEIQRDYVWGKKEVEGLLKSIKEDFEDFKNHIKLGEEWQVDIEMKNAFEQFYKKHKFSCNIGFIYAYNDPEYSGKYFLIDGQQRLTTIYLLLLVLASENSNFKDKFYKLYTFSKLPTIDYRVREASHHFLEKLVVNYNVNLDITDQPWYFKDYKSDKTITSIIANINIIKNFIKENNLSNDDDYIDYVQEYIEFWYFDTNVSEQGEELYIYMNARGEQMQDNENLKADLIGKIKQIEGCEKPLLELKNDWGTKWEEWQSFFWRNRKDNPNADKGFNEFISCVAGLENYLSSKSTVYSKEDFDNDKRGRQEQIAYSDILSQFENKGLEKISIYMKSLNFLFNKSNIQEFKQNYHDIKWVEKCLDEILLILNLHKTNWLADIKDSNRGVEHSRMVFIWSILHYMNTRDNTSNQNNDIFRALRLFYVRFKNYNRSVLSIESDIDNINRFGHWNIDGTEEENKKNNWYTKRISPEEIHNYEELIWGIEDHPLNIDGRDAKAMNCSHLINFEKEPDLEELKVIKDKFYYLFPINNGGSIDESNFKKLINILLFYGVFWERQSPWYCLNYCFSNWKKIIRNIDTTKTPFNCFFEDFKQISFEELYNKKVTKFEIDENTTDFIEQIKWYATQLNDKLWNQGYYIVSGHYHYPNNDLKFINSSQMLNTKGNFKGGNPQILSALLTTKNNDK